MSRSVKLVIEESMTSHILGVGMLFSSKRLIRIIKTNHDQDYNDNINILTTGDDRTRFQGLSLINDCYKYRMDPTTTGVVICDAIKFVQINKAKLISDKKEDNKKSLQSIWYQPHMLLMVCLTALRRNQKRLVYTNVFC